MTTKKNTRNTNTAKTDAETPTFLDKWYETYKALEFKSSQLEQAYHDTMLGLDPLAYSEPDTESFARARNALTDLLGVVKSFTITYDIDGNPVRADVTLDPDYFITPMPVENTTLRLEVERHGPSFMRAIWGPDTPDGEADSVHVVISDGLASFYLNWLDTLHMDAVRERLEMAGIQ